VLPVVSLLDTVLRLGVLAAAAGAAVVALTHWAVRSGRIPAFGPWARGVRKLSDPVLRPLERALVRWGRNPQQAPLWLLGLVIVSGILVLTFARWLVGFMLTLDSLRHAGPRAWISFAVDLGFNVLLLALLIRVVGSWLGAGRYHRLTRPCYLLTDWLVEPIRRRLPPLGPVDASPVVAYIGLLVLRWLLSPLV
jgi:YggT family protein